MKHLFTSAMLILFVSVTFGTANLMAQEPSTAVWIQQTGADYDSTTQIYSIDLEWKAGAIDDEHPQPDGYYLYRSMVGHKEPYDQYDMVGEIPAKQNSTGVFTYKVEFETIGVYEYYLIAYKGNEESRMSRRVMAVAMASYCVDLTAEIIDFVSFPETIAAPGDEYTYTAFAKHRSPRVQGWVRYELVESPEGMTIDNKTGEISWNVAEDAEGNHYVKVKATSDEDPRAESIQQWYISIATVDEMQMNPSSVSDFIEPESINLYPNPASDNIQLQLETNEFELQNTAVSIHNALGESVLSIGNRNINNIQEIDISNLPAGIYFLKIDDIVKKFVKY